MKTSFIALAIVLSLFVLGINSTSFAKGKTEKKPQTTHVVKKTSNKKDTNMQKSETSAVKSKKQDATAKHHKMHKMAKASKTSAKSHKSSTKTSKTSTKSTKPIKN